MRSVRALGVALALVALLPAAGSAQEGRPFKDSWFWGVKGGAVTYGQTAGGTGTAAGGGIDWLITRTTGGLYLSFGDALLNQVYYETPVKDSRDTASYHAINLKNMLRFELAAMAYPQISTRVHPYVGIGVSVQRLGASYSTAGMAVAVQDSLQSRVTTGRNSIGPLLIGGVQVRVPYVSVFAQGSFSSTQNTYYLSNGGSVGVEVGVRYNIGSSIAD